VVERDPVFFSAHFEMIEKRMQIIAAQPPSRPAPKHHRLGGLLGREFQLGSRYIAARSASPAAAVSARVLDPVDHHQLFVVAENSRHRPECIQPLFMSCGRRLPDSCNSRGTCSDGRTTISADAMDIRISRCGFSMLFGPSQPPWCRGWTLGQGGLQRVGAPAIRSGRTGGAQRHAHGPGRT